jgi:uncharacterized protein (DUF2141 family)
MKQSLILAIALFLLIAIRPETAKCTGSQDGIRVVVKGLRNDRGRVGCSLFNRPDGFPRDRKKQFRGMWVQKHNGVAECNFVGVPAGKYAVTVLDDTNDNGKMDFNFLGLPSKGYGFSNDAPATFSAPSFDDSSFTYNGAGTLIVPINIVYRIP